MRTTLTLDEDVAVQLQQLQRRKEQPFKQVVNEVLRVGLAHLDRPESRSEGPFTRPVSLGKPRLPDVDDVGEALAIAEGEAYR